MVSIDDRCRLRAVVTIRSGDYSVRSDDLGTYLAPERDVEVTREHLHATGGRVVHTKSPFAYLLERVG